MPHIVELLNGFNFINGLKIDGYTLVSTSGQHHEIRRYQEYSYDIELNFSGAGSHSNLINGINNMVKDNKIIYGVRNPYNCSISPISEHNIIDTPNGVKITMIGHSHRA